MTARHKSSHFYQFTTDAAESHNVSKHPSRHNSMCQGTTEDMK